MGTLNVTVITPTIPTRAELLGRAVNSVFAQTLKPYEHLIMVDVHREGAPIMLDRLLMRASTEWVAVLADDDEFLPHHLETLWNLVQSENADIGYSHFKYSHLQDAAHLERYRGQPFDNENPRQMTGVYLAKRELLIDVGGHSSGFDPYGYERDEIGNRVGEDFVIVKKLAAAGAKFAVSGEVTWIYHTGHANTLGMPNAW